MNQQASTLDEVEQEVLATPADSGDSPTVQSLESSGVDGPAQPAITNLNAEQPGALQRPLQASTEGLDLGQLGHFRQLLRDAHHFVELLDEASHLVRCTD